MRQLQQFLWSGEQYRVIAHNRATPNRRKTNRAHRPRGGGKLCTRMDADVRQLLPAGCCDRFAELQRCPGWGIQLVPVVCLTDFHIKLRTQQRHGLPHEFRQHGNAEAHVPGIEDRDLPRGSRQRVQVGGTEAGRPNDKCMSTPRTGLRMTGGHDRSGKIDGHFACTSGTWAGTPQSRSKIVSDQDPQRLQPGDAASIAAKQRVPGLPESPHQLVLAAFRNQPDEGSAHPAARPDYRYPSH